MTCRLKFGLAGFSVLLIGLALHQAFRMLEVDSEYQDSLPNSEITPGLVAGRIANASLVELRTKHVGNGELPIRITDKAILTEIADCVEDTPHGGDEAMTDALVRLDGKLMTSDWVVVRIGSKTLCTFLSGDLFTTPSGYVFSFQERMTCAIYGTGAPSADWLRISSGASRRAVAHTGMLTFDSLSSAFGLPSVVDLAALGCPRRP